MRELQPGLWHWQAPHPDWTPDEPWPQEVSSYAIDDGARLLLFDPQSVPNEILELAADREPVIVLTVPWHERDTRSLVERLDAPVFTPPPDTADDLVLWIESRHAVVLGDTLVDFGDGFEINKRLRGGVTREQVVERLRPLLDLPVDLVLPAHGEPTNSATLERALS